MYININIPSYYVWVTIKLYTKNVQWRNFVSTKEIQVKSRLLSEEGIKVPPSHEGRNAILEHAYFLSRYSIKVSFSYAY